MYSPSIHENRQSGRLVRVLGKVPPWRGRTSSLYAVQDILDERKFELPEWQLSQESYTEMEVLAWAASTNS